MFDVQLCGLGGVMCGVVQVPLGRVRVMGGQFVGSRFVMLCGFAMMAGRVVVVLGCFVMMLRCLVGHVPSSRFGLGWRSIDCARHR
jgi:hypothetical protein